MKNIFIWLILYSSLAFIILSTKLEPKEDEALKIIWNKLGLVGTKGRRCVKEDKKGATVSVVCHCPNTTCHVIKLDIKNQNCSSALLKEFALLPYLRYLDLSRNYLNGTIPSEWANMRLSNLSLMGNRLSGPFPKVLTKMTTLQDLSIEGNRFSGIIPNKIKNLINLNKLVISSNNFAGELPTSLANLTNLTDVRISDNNFTGKLPNFIGKWTKVEKLHIQGCSLEGPFPSSISALTQLNDLRITDLKGGASRFPSLKKMTNLKKLILRNCLIHGTIPAYIGDMMLQTLDLSFNNLSGQIPQSFANLGKAKYIYLTDNNLTGSMPEWVWTSTKDVDVSYNKFTWDASRKYECPHSLINTVESYSSPENERNILPCLWKDFPCTKSKKQQIHSLHINCGGDNVNINRSAYECDSQRKGGGRYYSSTDGYWALSSTGNFLDNGLDSDVYILSNTSSLHNIPTMDTPIYKTARTTAISLTYYGLCLLNGNYNVTLHFAEIVFTEDNSFNSLGKRVFDVYVQGILVLKDFDIVKEAGGTGRAVTKTCRVDVKNNTLKIQLYWAGKGTTCIPTRGSYGPLISAISVDPNFKPPIFGQKTLVPIIAGSVGGALLLLILVILWLWRKGYIMNHRTDDTQLTGRDLSVTRTYTLGQIKSATRNFDPSNKIGEGGFGSVFKGVLSDKTIIAIKKPSAKYANRVQDFVNEVGLVSTFNHPNLVKLYGSCTDHGNMLLIYEYMENNSLSHTIFGPSKVKLTWPVRFELCLGIARGLAYLHKQFSSSGMAIVHRDIKAENVLLDKSYKGKIADFGFAMIKDDKDSDLAMPFAGTIGYAAPEYATRGHLTTKADVYSFGILALEIVSGRSTNSYVIEKDQERVYLSDKAVTFNKQGKLLELVDRDLGRNYTTEEANLVLSVALLCIEGSPILRPTMYQALRVLEGHAHVQDLQQELIASDTDPATSVETPQLPHDWMLQSQSRCRLKRTKSFDTFFRESFMATVHDSP